MPPTTAHQPDRIVTCYNHNKYFDILTLAWFTIPHASEYAQTTQDKVDYHVYPSGTHVIKAFTANDFVFYNKNSHVLDLAL